MIDVLFSILFFLILALFYALMRCVNISLMRFSIVSFVLIYMLVFAYIGILPLYFQWDPYRVYSGVSDPNTVLVLFALSSVSIFLLLLGVIASKKLMRGRVVICDGFIRSCTSKEMLLMILVFTISLVVLLLYLIKVPEIAIFSVIKDPASKFAARSSMGNAFDGSYHWYKTFFSDVMLFILFSAYANKVIAKKKSASLFFLIVFVAAAFAAVMATEKGPFINLIIGLFIAKCIVKNNGQYPAKKGLVFIATVFLFLILFYVYFMGSTELLPALLSILSRTFTGQITPAYWYLEYFPKHHDFLGGLSFPNPGSLLPFIPFNIPVEISSWKFPEHVSMGIVGSAPTVYWGEMYANFGIWGVILFSFITGFFLQALDKVFQFADNNPLKIGVVVWLALHFSTLSGTGLTTFFADSYAVVVIGIFLSISFVANGCRIKFPVRRKGTERSCVSFI